MRSKTTVRHHLTLTGTGDSERQQECGEIGARQQPCGDRGAAPTAESRQSLKMTKDSQGTQQFHSTYRYAAKKTETALPHRPAWAACSQQPHSAQPRAQAPSGQWPLGEQENVNPPRSSTGCEKEQSPDTRYSTDDPENVMQRSQTQTSRV